jgi:nitrite reductase/ring-hydroxylating ferredoxin subunit
MQDLKSPMSSFQTVKQPLSPGDSLAITLGGKEILLVNSDGRFFAVDNICRCVMFVVGHLRPGEEHDPATHGGKLARLSEGHIQGHTVVCARHQSSYDLETGKPLSGGAEISLDTFEVREHDGQIAIAVKSDNDRRFWGD